MKRFQKLIKLTEYIGGFSLPARGITPLMTTAQSDATSKLAHLSGIQVLAARPECRQQGDSDSYSSVISTAFFVVSKALGAANTPERESRQYGELLDIAAEIVERITEDATSGNCGLLSGLSLSAVEIVPEASIFGGWLGYSLELTFD